MNLSFPDPRSPETAASISLVLRCIAGIAILAVLWLTSTGNYLLFHGIVELAGISVAVAIFLLVWNTRKVITDEFFLLIGISFLFIGSIDLLHTLAFKGMGVFPGNSADLPTQLWIAGRYFQSITFLAAAFLIGRSITREKKYDPWIFLAGCTIGTGLLLSGIFIWQNFPHAFTDGTGLTPFKIASEYVISLVLLATIAILFVKRDRFDPDVWRYLVAAQAFLIAGELAFTSYVSVYGFMNMLGHLFRLVSVYFFYEAIVVVGLTRPYDLLFRELRVKNDELGKLNEELSALNKKLTAAQDELHRNLAELAAKEQVVQQRNGELHAINEELTAIQEELRAANEELLYNEEALTLKNSDLGALNEELIAVQGELQRNVSELTLKEQELRENEGHLQDALAEKEILLSEIHHRVKNNLASFISLLSLEGGYNATPELQELKKDLQSRARSMSLIHETLYRTRKYSGVDMDLYLKTLVEQVAASYSTTRFVRTTVDADSLVLDLARATPCGLIASELITNSFKYAFPTSPEDPEETARECAIAVSLKNEAGEYILSIRDNGVGLPAGYDPATAQSLGLKLVYFLARHQLRATVDIDRSNGTAFAIRFRDRT